MDLIANYNDNYIILAGLRQYVEKGIMLASVNFFRDSLQNYPEFTIIQNRERIVQGNHNYTHNEFLNAFVAEDFPEIEGEIPASILTESMALIKEQEGEQTANITKHFLIEYAVTIAKSSEEDWLAFMGLKDSISDSEAQFIQSLEELFEQ